jgi:Holliday junction resolvase
MSRKGKGINAERELFHILWGAGFASARVAGSGSNKYPSVDIIAGKGERKLAIECKTMSDDAKYFGEQEISDAREFATRFGAELWLALKFSKTPWYFVSTEDLEKTPTGYKISKNTLSTRGFSVQEVIENTIKK